MTIFWYSTRVVNPEFFTKVKNVVDEVLRKNGGVVEYYSFLTQVVKKITGLSLDELHEKDRKTLGRIMYVIEILEDNGYITTDYATDEETGEEYLVVRLTSSEEYG